jgi:uncharacterized protein (DUF433 family)
MRFEWRKYIEAIPKVMMGKPVFTGTRIPVDLIFEKLPLVNPSSKYAKRIPASHNKRCLPPLHS